MGKPDPPARRSAGSEGGFFRTRWRGEVPLDRLFWRDMLLVGTVLSVASSALALLLLGLKLPLWLVVTMVSRDGLIVCAVLLSSVMSHPVEVKPLFVSKANTAAQIVLAALVLGELASSVHLGPLRTAFILLTGVLTVASAAAYLVAWLRHMSGYGEGSQTGGSNTDS